MKILFIIIIVPSDIIPCNMVVLPQMRALPDSFFHVTFPKLSFFWIFFPLEYLEYLSIWQYFLWKTRALPDSFSIHGTFPKLFFFWIGTKFCTFRTSLWSLLMRGKIHYTYCAIISKEGEWSSRQKMFDHDLYERCQLVVPGVRMKINVTRSNDQMIIKRGSSGPKTKSSPTSSSASSDNGNQLTIKWAKDQVSFLAPISERTGEPV